MFFHKFLECCSIWLTLDLENRDAAGRSFDFVSENLKNIKAGSIEYANLTPESVAAEWTGDHVQVFPFFLCPAQQNGIKI